VKRSESRAALLIESFVVVLLIYYPFIAMEVHNNDNEIEYSNVGYFDRQVS
jgi:hypothetical protein